MFHKKFLRRFSDIFDNVSYYPDDACFDFEEYLKACKRTLRYSESLKDTKQILKDIKDVKYYRNAIARKIKKHFDFYYAIDHKTKEIEAVENEAVITITNDLTDDLDYSICLPSFLEDQSIEIIHSDGVYRMNDDSYSYFIKHVKDEDDTRVVIYDKDETPVCTVYMGDEVDIYLEENETNLFIQNKDEEGIAIFNADCVKKSKNNPSIEDMTAFLEWDLVDHNFMGCVARLNLFKTDITLELLLLFVVAIFLLEKKSIEKAARELRDNKF